MTWEQIRAQFPHQWLLVEAITARSQGNRRIVDVLEVVERFPSGRIAMKAYGQLHHQEPQRELYVVHTDRPDLEIQERWWLGIRGVA